MQYTLPKGYLSPSAIKTLQTCPKQYEFRYIHNIINPPSAAQAVGSVTHKTLETYYNDAISSEQRLTPKQVAELSGDTLEEWSRDNESLLTDNDKKEAHTLLPSMVSGYVENIGQYIRPIATEQEIRTTLPCGVPVLGYIDLLFAHGEDTAIADYKVTGKKLSKGDLSNSLQFNLYALMTGIGNIQIHNLVKAKSRPVGKHDFAEGVTDYASNLRRIEHTFDGGEAEYFTQLVESAARLITSGIFMPCAPDSWCCNANWCGYWQYCRGRRS